MKIADLTSGGARLRDTTDVLLAAWADSCETWRDANSRNLEENHLKPLADDVTAALAAIRHLSEVLAAAQRECESW